MGLFKKSPTQLLERATSIFSKALADLERALELNTKEEDQLAVELQRLADRCVVNREEADRIKRLKFRLEEFIDG